MLSFHSGQICCCCCCCTTGHTYDFTIYSSDWMPEFARSISTCENEWRKKTESGEWEMNWGYHMHHKTISQISNCVRFHSLSISIFLIYRSHMHLSAHSIRVYELCVFSFSLPILLMKQHIAIFLSNLQFINGMWGQLLLSWYRSLIHFLVCCVSHAFFCRSVSEVIFPYFHSRWSNDMWCKDSHFLCSCMSATHAHPMFLYLYLTW